MLVSFTNLQLIGIIASLDSGSNFVQELLANIVLTCVKHLA